MLTQFRTNDPRLTFPASPSAAAGQVLAVAQTLERSQWWELERLEAAQQRQLRVLVEHARATTPAYQDLPPPPASDAEFRQWWRSLPIVDRETLQASETAYFSDAVPASHQPVEAVRTSGSTGRPVRSRSTHVSRFFELAFALRAHRWHEWHFDGTLVSIRPDRSAANTDEGDRFPTWGPPADIVAVTGESAVLDSRADIAHQLDWLVRQDPTYLISMPSNLKGLAEETVRRNVSLPNLRGVRGFSEVLSDAVREQCTEAWGVPIRDLYSSQEAGTIAIECPLGGGLHVQSERILVEVLTDQGELCAPGDEGRLVLTPLHNFAAPLIRYEIFDRAIAGAPCACGRGLPVIERVLGRERNLMTYPDGRRVWPSFPSAVWNDVAPIQQIQMTQQTLHDIHVRFAGPRALTASEQAAASESLGRSLGYPFSFSFERVDVIARGENGKYEDFRSELAVESLARSNDGGE